VRRRFPCFGIRLRRGKRVTFSCIMERKRWGSAGRHVSLSITFVSMEPAVSVPARILIVMAAQWPRALLRAELREAGYDALGARDLDEALTYPREEAGRGPVRLIILDQAVSRSRDDPRLVELLQKHQEAQTLLLRYPTTIAEISQTTQQLLPLPPAVLNPRD
jgi:PleD family two-component response regulator